MTDERKFRVGDEVRFNYNVDKRHQVPDYVRKDMVGRTRKIVATYYDATRKREFYMLGARGRKQSYPYAFSSHQLVLAPAVRKRGKPPIG